MSYRNYILVTSAVILGLTLCVACLYYDRAHRNTNWWDAAIQQQAEDLRRIISLESLVELGQLNEISTELLRHRLRSLTSLLTMMAQQFKPGSRNMVYARRVFYAEVLVDLPEPINGGEVVGVRIVRGTEPQCEPRVGYSYKTD